MIDELTDFTAQIPDGWTTGEISFKAKVCTNEFGKTVPDVDGVICTNNREVDVKPMISNVEELNHTVDIENNKINVLEGFNKYGKISIHMVTVPDEELDTIPGSQINKAKINCVVVIAS